MPRRYAPASIAAVYTVALALLCLAAPTLYSLSERENIISQLRAELTDVGGIFAEFVAIAYSNVNLSAERLLQELGQNPTLLANPEALAQKLAPFASGPLGISGIVVFDEKGRQLGSYPRDLLPPPSAFAAWQALTARHPLEGTYIFPATYDVRTKTATSIVLHWHTLPDTGLVFVGTMIDQNALSSLFSSFQPIPETVISLVNRDQMLVARFPLVETLFGVPLDNAAVFKAAAATDADVVSLTATSIVDAKERLAVARQLREKSLTLAISVPLQGALATWRTNTAINVGLGMAFATLVAIGGWHLARILRVNERAARQLDGMLAAAPAGMAILDDEGRFVRQSSLWTQFANVLQVPPSSRTTAQSFVSNLQARKLLLEHDNSHPVLDQIQETGYFRLSGSYDAAVDRDGQLRAFELIFQSADSTSDVDFGGSVMLMTDTTEYHKLQSKLAAQLTTDQATGLLNRRGLVECIANRLKSRSTFDRDKSTARLVVFEVLGMEDIVATYGFDESDEIGIEIARRLRALDSDRFVVARLAAPTFAVFFDVDRSEQDEALRVVQDRVQQEYRLAGHTAHLQMAGGAADFKGDSPSRLLHAAEIALNRARGRGIANIVYFNPELELASRERLELYEALGRAVRENQFVLYYQPKVDLLTAEVVALEALIRWRHPIFGLQSPGLFMPLAERTGLVVQIGSWVIEEVCRQQAAWQGAGAQIVPVAINISPVQFDHVCLNDEVAQATKRYQLQTSMISAEITETTISDNPELVAETIRRLRELGVCVALDDFGSGYSSLGMIAQLSLDEIKIDKSFVEHLGSDEVSDQIIASVVAIGQRLKIAVTAEGVETEEQREALLRAGCKYGQGYLFHRPMPPDDIRLLLQSGAGS